MYLENGWWYVAHDHVSGWAPKERWIIERIDYSQWRCEAGQFDYDKPGTPLLKPLRWGFKDKNIALMFALKWS